MAFVQTTLNPVQMNVHKFFYLPLLINKKPIPNKTAISKYNFKLGFKRQWKLLFGGPRMRAEAYLLHFPLKGHEFRIDIRIGRTICFNFINMK